MRLFKDNEGREWRVEINVAQVKRVRSLAGVDIYKMGDDFLVRFGELLQDVVQLVDVLWVLVMDQAKKEQVTDEDFGRALGGDALGKATDAFAEELVDFFRDAGMRQMLREYLAKDREIRAAAAGAGTETLRKLVAKDLIDQAQKGGAGGAVAPPSKHGAANGSPTTAPAASGSTPAR